jgi:hypothetical protein
MSGVIFRLVGPPEADKRVDPLEAVRASGVLPLFEEMERTPAPDATLRPYFPRGVPGVADLAALRPRLKKPKIFGVRLERLVAASKPGAPPAHEPSGPLDPSLLREALAVREPAAGSGVVARRPRPAAPAGKRVKKEKAGPKKKRVRGGE